MPTWNQKKLGRKQKSLTVHGDFDKIIDTDSSDLCLLGVSMKNSINRWANPPRADTLQLDSALSRE